MLDKSHQTVYKFCPVFTLTSLWRLQGREEATKCGTTSCIFTTGFREKTKRVKPELDPGKGERMLTIYATTTICYNEQAVEIKLNTGGRQL